ncbi:hypothetical protein SB861_58285, partial [Paraburkholderia sp. SIMBA_049]
MNRRLEQREPFHWSDKLCIRSPAGELYRAKHQGRDRVVCRMVDRRVGAVRLAPPNQKEKTPLPRGFSFSSTSFTHLFRRIRQRHQLALRRTFAVVVVNHQ